MNGEELGTIFSCPGRSERGSEISTILASNARDYVVGLLRRRGEQIEHHSHGLVPLLQSVIDEPSSWDLGLAFPWPVVASGLSGEEPDVALVAAKVAGHVYGCGRTSPWRAQFARPRALRIGRHITPLVASLTVEGEVIEYQTAAGATMRTTVTAAEGMRALGEVVVDGEQRLWLADGEDRDAMQLDGDWPFTTMSLDHRVQELSSAVEFVRQHAPEYLSWFGDAVRVIASWIGADQVLKSGSLPGNQGLIYISSPLPVVRLAESLVHEASHQYFQSAETVDRFTGMTAEERMYWSPYANTHRHLDRILFAFHAFANVTAFYQQVLRGQIDDGLRAHSEKTLEFHRPHLDAFRGYLRSSEELTPAGRALFLTVNARIES
jgi:HEXXH motif-containing protein